MHYPLFLGKHVVDDEYTNWLYKPFYFLSVVFGFVNTQGPNISVDGRRLFLFGLILHQTPSQFLPHVELFSEGRKALTSQLLCKRERFLSCLKFVSQPGPLSEPSALSFLSRLHFTPDKNVDNVSSPLQFPTSSPNYLKKEDLVQSVYCSQREIPLVCC